MPNLRLKVRTQRRPAQVATACQNDDRITYWEATTSSTAMCPTAFLAPTLTAKIWHSAWQIFHKMHFFWPSLRCKVIEQMAKSRYLVEFPAQKKEPKWFQNLGRFQKNSSCSVEKKVPKIGPGPALALNMVRRKKFIKWQTPSRNAKSSFEGANPNAKTSPSGDRLPERRSYHVK